eukprot:scaffold1697_cov120-Cylindrotheca_fusiformis.AAC.31
MVIFRFGRAEDVIGDSTTTIDVRPLGRLPPRTTMFTSIARRKRAIAPLCCSRLSIHPNKKSNKHHQASEFAFRYRFPSTPNNPNILLGLKNPKKCYK